MSQKRYEISDEQWIQIENLFPVAITGRSLKNNHLMLNAVLWIASSVIMAL